MGDSDHEHTQAQSRGDISRQTPPPKFAPGDQLPNLEMWTLERRLGGGGFGEVWLARHERKGAAAVKFCTDPVAKHQLVHHERAVVARVMKYGGDHPNIVPLLECNLSGDIPWLMYEYVEGGTLAEAVAQWAALPPPRRLGRAVRVLHAVTSALAQFHHLRPPLVHRDLKPQNVLMAGTVPRITDFGIGGMAVEAGRADKSAELSGSGLNVRVPTMLRSVGSARYAPQEQFLGSPPDPRDDVYAIGVLAYQMMFGDLNVLPGPDVLDALRALKVPSELAALTARSVALDPARRPRDAGAWERALGALLSKKTVPQTSVLKAAEDSRDEPTETMDALGSSVSASAALVTQTLDIGARGRWYSRTTTRGAEWRLVAATPGEVRVVPGELYRFSINSAATEEDVRALGRLAGLDALVYLNLSYCEGVTDAGVALLKGFRGVRHLYLRACPRLTDRGLTHLRGLASLRVLELTGSGGVTDAAVAALQQALPACKIVR
ncbi:serine/threonine protein kinase [Gemmata sp. JC673]|uniref:Serine/threonine protein kinase n=1 Tax=Gemmata algarum TaxID=2975278 RepID=A0ABU5F4F1_9BACT|nr:serine/threonine-protein kinase [Gemmata algarum]MDY3562446.1 serine/threonine protein kinase [Gemmata algarum]